MNRRGFLLGAGLFVAAPAIIRAPGLLMPVKPLPRRLITFDVPILAGNGYDAGGFKTVGPFRYAVLYEAENDDNLIAYWDRASDFTVELVSAESVPET